MLFIFKIIFVNWLLWFYKIYYFEIVFYFVCEIDYHFLLNSQPH